MLGKVVWSLALTKLKERVGIRQKELAETLEVKESSVSRWFNGTGVPTGDKAERVRDYLEKHLSQTEADLLREIKASDKLTIVLDSKSRVLALSDGFTKLMRESGIEGWDTKYSEDGMMRIIEMKSSRSRDKS